MKARLRDGSGWREYKYVSEETDSFGRVYTYFRRKGQKKIRLREIPGTEEFDREYRRAFIAAPAPAKTTSGPAAPNTLRWLVERYYRSPIFLELADDTRRVRARVLDAITERHGHKPFAGMELRDVTKIRDEKASAPEAANSRIKTLRQLFKWACSPEYDYARRNPARDVPYLKPKNPDGHHAWTIEEILQYRARHPVGTKARLALDLFLYTGVRISDVIKLGRHLEKNGPRGDERRWVAFTETKNGKRKPKHREIPILPELQETLDASGVGNFQYLITAFGRPYATPKSFGNRFKSWCMMAGLPHCAAHGMRKAGATIAAENGATNDDLKALFGWESSKQVDLYTKKAQRKKIAAKSMQLIRLEQELNESVQTPKAV